jgi:L-amino acid N-acyltransferase YncA
MLIRLATPFDAARLLEIYRPIVEETAISFESVTPSETEMAARVERTLARTPWLVCDDDGDVLGFAYAGPHRDRAAYQWSVDVTAYVHLAARRRGIARALYTSLFSLLALQGHRNAYAGIALPNDASVALHQALGFTHVGTYLGVGWKLGVWHDVAWYARPLAPRVARPAPPMPFARLIGDDQVPAALAAGASHFREAGR